jgi:hypothetical protein
MRSREPALSEAEGTPTPPHPAQPPQGIVPVYMWGGHSCPPPLRLMSVRMSPPPQPTGAPSFRVLCERMGLHTAGSEGLARNWKPETRNLTALSTVSGHTFSRADQFLNPCHPERSRRACPERSRRDPYTPTPLHNRRKAFSPCTCGADTVVRRRCG